MPRIQRQRISELLSIDVRRGGHIWHRGRDPSSRYLRFRPVITSNVVSVDVTPKRTCGKARSSSFPGLILRIALWKCCAYTMWTIFALYLRVFGESASLTGCVLMEWVFVIMVRQLSHTIFLLVARSLFVSWRLDSNVLGTSCLCGSP
jgi:hypothetical protein